MYTEKCYGLRSESDEQRIRPQKMKPRTPLACICIARAVCNGSLVRVSSLDIPSREPQLGIFEWTY